VDDAEVVGFSEGFEDLADDAFGDVEGQRSLTQDLGEWFSADELEDHEGIIVAKAGVKEADHVRAGEIANEAHLAQESYGLFPSGVDVFGEPKEEGLDGHDLPGRDLAGFVDDAEAARADFLKYFIAFEEFALTVYFGILHGACLMNQSFPFE